MLHFQVGERESTINLHSCQRIGHYPFQTSSMHFDEAGYNDTVKLKHTQICSMLNSVIMAVEARLLRSGSVAAISPLVQVEILSSPPLHNRNKCRFAIGRITMDENIHREDRSSESRAVNPISNAAASGRTNLQNQQLVHLMWENGGPSIIVDAFPVAAAPIYEIMPLIVGFLSSVLSGYFMPLNIPYFSTAPTTLPAAAAGTGIVDSPESLSGDEQKGSECEDSRQVLVQGLTSISYLSTLSRELIITLIYDSELCPERWRPQAELMRDFLLSEQYVPEPISNVPYDGSSRCTHSSIRERITALSIIGRSRGIKCVVGNDYVIEQLTLDASYLSAPTTANSSSDSIHDTAITAPGASASASAIQSLHSSGSRSHAIVNSTGTCTGSADGAGVGACDRTAGDMLTGRPPRQHRILYYKQVDDGFSNPNSAVNAKALGWLCSVAGAIVQQQQQRLQHPSINTHAATSPSITTGASGSADVDIARCSLDNSSCSSTDVNRPLDGENRLDPQTSTQENIDLLEMFCGNGNHTVALAAYFHCILGVELNPSLCDAAKENFRRNGISNAHVVVCDSAKFATQILKSRSYEWKRSSTSTTAAASTASSSSSSSSLSSSVVPASEAVSPVPSERATVDSYQFRFGAVLVDPPRRGLDISTLRLVQQYQHILYISCSPESLERDLHTLLQTHTLERAAIFDQFTYTPHIETGVWLKQRV